MNIESINLKRIVILGGGFGGIEFAKKINKHKFQVVMIDKNNYHTFQPLLYQVATGGLEPDSIAYPLRKIFTGEKNFHLRVAEVTRINADDKTIDTSAGNLSYDYLVIATGSTTNFFGNSEIENYAMPMKSITDALDLRSLILQNFEKLLTENNAEKRDALLNIVIVGGGPTGVEVAGALAELRKHVLPNDYAEINFDELKIHLVEASQKILAVMAPASAEKANTFLTKMGIKIWLNTSVAKCDETKAYLNDGTVINTNTVIWTAGVKGKTINGFDEGSFTKSSRYKVDVYNQLIGQQNVFVIGDAACIVEEDKLINHPMLAPVAMQQAKKLANNLNSNDSTNWTKFQYRDLGSMATVGRNKAVVELGKLKFQGVFAWFVWIFVHLMSIVGFRNKLIVLINWTWNYFSYDRAIRLIIRPYHKKVN